MKRIICSAFLAIAASTSALGASNTYPKPNNSGKNDPTLSRTDASAQDQGTDQTDLDLTQKIRRSLTKDSSFSVAAQNVKIISNNGNVILRGPVNSLKEKQLIEKNASSFQVSSATLTSYLEVMEQKK